MFVFISCTSRIHILHLSEFISLTDDLFPAAGPLSEVFRGQAGSLCVPFVAERFVLLKGSWLKRCGCAQIVLCGSSINNMTSGKLTEALEVFDKEENGSANRTQGWNNTGWVLRMNPCFIFSPLQWRAKHRPSSCSSHTPLSHITTLVYSPGLCVQ